MNELPKEITYTPVPYIGLIGLDAVKNPIHTLIWNTLAINRASDRLPLYYKLIPDNYEFPALKSKKPEDKSNVKGILKTNWLSKHLFLVPSVVVIFEKINSSLLKNDEFWQNYMARLNKIGNNLQSKQAKIVLVFLQSNADILTDDLYKDVNAKISTECDFFSKCLIIPIHEHNLISQYVTRIENVLFDLSKLYYTNQAKIIKTHKDSFNKSSQLYLFIRLEFKLGFYNEIRQIYAVALTHYKNAYVSLMEIQSTPVNVYEVKNIASLLNYRICRLSFYLNNPMDAISHFKKHIEIFQNMVGPKQIEFEHFSWLGTQYQMFGESFEMAVNVLALSPSSNLHPGIYFFEAAMYFTQKRKAASQFKTLFASITQEEINHFNAFLDAKNRIFIGQFPWRNDSAGGAINHNDEIGFKALQFREVNFDNNKHLVGLYNNVLNYLKRFKKSRFIKFIMYLIGREYYLIDNHLEALSYLSSIISFYREEKWQVLYFEILEVALKSSYYSVDYNNFIKFGLEMMFDESKLLKHRINIIKSILALLNLKFKPLLLLAYEDEKRNEVLEDKWQGYLNKLGQSDMNELPINMDKGLLFLEFKTAFGASSYQVGETITIEVVVLSHLPVDVELAGYHLKFNNAHYDQLCVVNDCKQTLKSDIMNRFKFAIKPVLEDIGKNVFISQFALKLNTKIPVSFHWSCFKQDDTRPQFMFSQDERYAFHKFVQRTETKILNHQSRLEVETCFDERIFLNEKALFNLKFKSNEAHAINNLKLSVKLIGESNQVEDLNCFGLDEKGNSLELLQERTALLERLLPQEQDDRQIIVQLPSLGRKKLVVNLIYDLQLDGENVILVTKRITMEVECIEPFVHVSSVRNLNHPQPINIRTDEPFQLALSLKPSSDMHIQVSSFRINFTENIEQIGENKTPNLFPLLLSEDLNQEFVVKASQESGGKPYALGTFTVCWFRNHANQRVADRLLNVETTLSLPSVIVSRSLVFVQLILPKTCLMRNPFMATYKIYNRTTIDTIIQLSMGPSDSFMISGNKLTKSLVGGMECIEESYIFLPITKGDIALPQMDIILHHPNGNEVMIDYVNQMIPSTLHVEACS